MSEEIKKALGIEKIAVCDECRHYYDTRDKRSYHRQDCDVSHQASTCPACWQEQHGGTEAWALWNNCQGIWSDMIFNTRAEAKAKMEGLADPECYSDVVPVRVYKETDEGVWRRNWLESEIEKQR